MQEGVIRVMKIVCSKSELSKGVNIVSKAVPNKTTMAILECILIDASTNEIKLTANNTELGIETIIEGEIKERGVIALDAKIFSEMVRKLPENDVEITTDSSFKTIISCEKSIFNITGKSGEDFSYLPYIERENPIVLSQYAMKELVRCTIFSIAESDTSPVMSGELAEVNENLMRLISLDGHRISIRCVELEGSYPYRKAIIPGSTLSEIGKILNDDVNEEVRLFFTQNHAVFEFERTTVVSRLIEGEFYNVDRMLSSDYETKITINKKELLECMDRAILLVREGDKKPIIMDITDGNMELKINSFIGSMDENIGIEKEGKDIKIAFNPKFFIDALRVVEDEDVSIYMVNPKAPCFIRDDVESYIYIILPVNFNAISS